MRSAASSAGRVARRGRKPRSGRPTRPARASTPRPPPELGSEPLASSAMNKAELQSKHLSELHELAAKAGVERYRMLPREELIDALADGDGGEGGGKAG